MSTDPRVLSSLKSVIPTRVRWALSILRKGVPPPPPLPPLPTMITGQEKDFLIESARELAPRDGAIVELGCWMGASAIALAEGLRARPGGPGAARVLTHDWFRWLPGDEKHSGYFKPFGIYEQGEDFAPESRRYIRDHAGELVEIRKVDLSTYEWTEGPISLLHVDAMKLLPIARQVTRWFYPSMFPGSILIHQDYKHFWTSWIHRLQYRLRSKFELLRSVVGGVSATVAFRCVSPISLAEAASVLDGEPSDDEVERCFEWSKGLVGEDLVNVSAAHVMEYVHLGRIQQARELLTKYRAAGLAERGEMPRLIDMMKGRGMLEP